MAIAIGSLALVWGIFNFPQSEATDNLRDVESRLLRYETFSHATLASILASPVSMASSPCDTHAQRALLLMEMPLAEAALRAGASDEFDRRINSLEHRAKQALGCTPRESFVWLLLFNLEALHGQLSEHAFNLLARSYETSPNEAWISIRRITVAMPLLLIASEPVRKLIILEFTQLIRNNFINDAARAYLAASPPVRKLLITEVDRLDITQQKSFTAAIQQLRS